MSAMAGSGGRSGDGGGLRPAPRAGAGPTVIAAGLVVLVIGLGWLNHSGDTGGDTAFERDVANAVERAQELGEIPGSEAANPAPVGGAGGGDGTGRTTSTTIVTDPETGIQITVNLPPASGSSGSSSTTGSTGSGTTGTTSGGGGTTGTTSGGGGGTGTTAPPSTNPPSTNPPTTDPPTTNPPTTTDPTTTEPPTTSPPTTQGLLDGLLGILGL
jgi:hypothetical protein